MSECFCLLYQWRYTIKGKNLFLRSKFYSFLSNPYFQKVLVFTEKQTGNLECYLTLQEWQKIYQVYLLPLSCHITYFSDFFAVNRYTGQVYVQKSLVFYTGTYMFQVEARDEDGQGPFRGYANITIIVLPAANTAPVWVIPPKDNETIYVLEVSIILCMLLRHLNSHCRSLLDKSTLADNQ